MKTQNKTNEKNYKQQLQLSKNCQISVWNKDFELCQSPYMKSAEEYGKLKRIMT